MITQEELKELLHYEPDTGVFTWLISTGNVAAGDIGGSINGAGYARIGIRGKEYFAHRVAWLYVYGYFPENDVDHRDRIKHHNWISNLREVSVSCNMRNRNIGKNNKSGVIGVRLNTNGGGWVAQIKVHKKSYYLGAFNNKDDAVLARWKAEIKHEFPNCNTTSSALKYLKSKGVCQLRSDQAVNA